MTSPVRTLGRRLLRRLTSRRGRWDNLRRIEALDPVADRDEIVRITSREEFPWDYVQGTGIAFLRDYGVPSISRLLARTREFEDHGVKRYDDTLLFADPAVDHGVDSAENRESVRRLNRIHGHYDIPNDEFAYVLSTTIVGPVRWISAYGWRQLHPHELQALASFTTRFGELMGIKDLPTTYDGYLDLLVSYERERFEHDPANTRLTHASLDIAVAVAPWWQKPLTRRVVVALMDDHLRTTLGFPAQPEWFRGACRAGLRLRGRWLRHLAGPRRTPYRHRPSTYPQGFTLGDLGPASMLDELNTRRTRAA